MQPAEIGALKPLLVNTAHVAAKDEGSFGSGYLSMKQHLVAHPMMSADLFSAVLTDAERTALSQIDGLGDSVEIASIELLGDGGPSIPVVVPIPKEVREWATGSIVDLFGRIRSYYIETTGVRVWE